MKEQERMYLMALAQIPGMEQPYLKALAAEFPTFSEAWQSDGAWRNVLPVAKDKLEFILQGKKKVEPDKIHAYAEKIHVKICTIRDPEYPPHLLEVHRNPYFLYYFGTLPSREEWLFTIVGMRQCSRYGRDVAEKFARELVQTAGMAIVSGLAIGVDTAAHLGALRAGGRTVAVLPSGIDEVYPRENQGLFREIKERGCLLTEYPFHFMPMRSTFPYRNRLMSGLGRGVLLVEGRASSGAMHTVNHGLEQGKDIFAVPGPIFSPSSEGPHLAIKAGAKLVHSVDDILSEYFDLEQIKAWLEAKANPAPAIEGFSEAEKKVWTALAEGPLYFDDLQMISGLSPASLATLMTDWELDGFVEALPGKFYRIAKTINEVNHE